MICVGCRKGFHDGCRGGTWCDCQHRAPSNRWVERARIPHETGCAHVVMYPAPCDCKPLELDALMADVLGEHGRSDL